MDRDDLMQAVGRLDAVAERFEGIAKAVDEHATRIASLEQSRSSIGKLALALVAPLIVGLVLFFLVGKGHP